MWKGFFERLCVGLNVVEFFVVAGLGVSSCAHGGHVCVVVVVVCVLQQVLLVTLACCELDCLWARWWWKVVVVHS